MGRTILGQVLGSTTEDTQGERYDKEFLEQMVRAMPQRVPLHQRHDLGRPCAGFITNLRVAPHPDVPGEWAVLADVELSDEAMADPDLKGFSWSATVPVKRNADMPHFAHFIPFPAYNHGALDELLDQDEPVQVGKWLKKAATPEQVALLVGLVVFVLTPVWDQVFKKVFWPRLQRQFELLRARWWRKGFSTDFVQMAELPSGDAFQILFVPERGHEEMAYSEDILDEGMHRGTAAALQEWNAGRTPRRVRLLYDRVRGWQVIAIEFADGNVAHLVPPG